MSEMEMRRLPDGQLGYVLDGLTFAPVPGGLTVLSCSSDDFQVEVPAQVAGKPVLSLEEKAFARRQMNSVVLPEGLREIGKDCFLDCQMLVSVELPASLRKIGQGAFARCYSLMSVELPEGLAELGPNAFTNCKGLMSVTLPNSLRRISREAFSQCGNLFQIEIPGGVTEIGDLAFGGCAELTRATLNEGLLRLGARAFADCAKLTEVRLPESLRFSGATPFFGCNQLQLTPEPGSRLERLVLSAGFPAKLGGGLALFPGENGRILIARTNSDNTMTLVLLKSRDTRFILPQELGGKRLTRIGPGAFVGDPELSHLILPEGVTHLCDGAFEDCFRLHRLELPMSLTSFGEHVFEMYCSEEEKLLALTGAPDAEFHGRRLTVTAPKGSAAERCCKQHGIPCRMATDDPNSQEAKVANLVALTESEEAFTYRVLPDGTAELAHFNEFRSTDTIFLIQRIAERDLVSIGPKAFAGCQRIKHVLIQPPVKRICSEAFADCPNLTSLLLPPCLTEIAPDAFRGSPNVRLMVQPNTPSLRICQERGWPHTVFQGKKPDTPAPEKPAPSSEKSTPSTPEKPAKAPPAPTPSDPLAALGSTLSSTLGSALDRAAKGFLSWLRITDDPNKKE